MLFINLLTYSVDVFRNKISVIILKNNSIFRPFRIEELTMSDLKTKPNNKSVEQFLNSLENKTRVADAKILLELMRQITAESAILWGSNIVGFGQYHYVYDSGCEGDWMKTGFSPRKANMTVYIMEGFASHSVLLEKLGKHKLGKSCLYINKLADVDLDILKLLISDSYQNMNKKYG